MMLNSDRFQDQSVCILGMGYVGLTLAVAMTEAGFRVHGLEVRQDILESLAQGKPHFWEPGLEEKLTRAVRGGRLTVSRELDASVDVSVYIITVGTPLGPDGVARLDMVENATRQVSNHMKDGVLIILRSTVKIGTARKVVHPIALASGKTFQIAVCPERTLEGNALKELRELPQIVGADDSATMLRATQIFTRLTPTVVRVDGLETAEVIKLVDNTYRDVTFAFGNEVARLCDAVGIRASEVIKAGKFGYPRTSVALPGPVGGPCLEKDPHIMAESAEVYGVSLDITRASRLVNERQPVEVAEFLGQFTARLADFPSQPKIALLGLAFKGNPATNDLRGTMAVPFLKALQQRYPSGSFHGWDAVVNSQETRELGLCPAASLEEAFEGANLVLILNNHNQLARMDLTALTTRMARPGVVYDCWNLFNEPEMTLAPGTLYVALGSHARPIGLVDSREGALA